MAALPAPLALAGGAAAIVGFALAARGMPREGEVRRGGRVPGSALFHLGLAVLSISLLAFMPLARDPLSRLEPFASSRALLELALAAVHVAAVSPLLALAGAAPAALPAAAALRLGLRRFAFAMPPLLLLGWCVLEGARAAGAPAPVQPPLADFVAQSWDVRAALALLVVVAAPLAEEAVFRGALHPALSRIAGAPLSRVATAALFGALHGWYAAVPVGLLGYFLAGLRDAGGRLLPCVVIHGVYNGTALALYAAFPSIRDLYAP